MKNSELIGVRVSILVSDPWEFGTECGVGPFSGEILDVDGTNILTKLDRTIEYQGKTLSGVICTIRHSAEQYECWPQGRSLSVNFLLIDDATHSLSEARIRAGSGSVAAIGTVLRI
jgi:hypothetical protein